MLARDLYHQRVVNALLKDGWSVTDDPLRLRLGKKDMYIDVRVLQQQFRHHLLELLVLLAQPRHFTTGRFAFGVARQPRFAGFQKFLAPFVVHIWG